jgi:hypothetical protein
MRKTVRVRARRQRREAVILPTPERLAHGPVERLGYPVLDAGGVLSRPLIGLDTLARMERAGTISNRERRAGDRFHVLFRRASLDGFRVPDLDRAVLGRSVTSNGNGKSPEGSEAAKLAVLSAVDALGGMASPTGSCAWYVLGLEMSIKSWVECRYRTRPLDVMMASGILVADLGILRAHWNC